MTKKQEVREVLIAVDKLFTTEEQWTKGRFAGSKASNTVKTFSRAAIKWCLTGGVDKVMGKAQDSEVRYAVSEKLTRAIKKLYPKRFDKFVSMVGFNDNKRTTFKQLKRVLKKAIES